MRTQTNPIDFPRGVVLVGALAAIGTGLYFLYSASQKKTESALPNFSPQGPVVYQAIGPYGVEEYTRT